MFLMKVLIRRVIERFYLIIWRTLNLETKGDSIVLEVLNNDMGLNIDRSHRIGNPKTKKKSRPIIVKFVRYYDRRDVFMNKKCLNGKGKSITESISAFSIS